MTLFVGCEEAVIFEKSDGEEMISLSLPLDLEITFASLPGDKASKFLGYWQTAEISPSGFLRRPWHCENRSDSLPLPFTMPEDKYMDLVEHSVDPGAPKSPESLGPSEIRNYQQHQSEPAAPPGTGRSLHPRATQEEWLHRLQERLESLSNMLGTVRTQNTDLLARVQYLESCECRRPTCSWEGKEHKDGDSWEQDGCSLCVCVKGDVTCSLRREWPQCRGCSYEGRNYTNGETFSTDACTACVCLGGEVSCSQVECPVVTCRTPARKAPAECCPRCVEGCADGHQEGETWRPEPCTSCSCLGGQVMCIPEACQPANCAHPILLQDKCCPECTGCVRHGQRLKNGQSYQADPCTKCTCRNGNVQCEGPPCQDLNCLEQFTPPGECCPICRPGCEYEGQQYQNGDYFLARSNPCLNCSCLNNLVRCGPVQCQSVTCSSPRPGQCCPICPACELDGRALEHGENVTTADGCRRCICKDGELVCTDIRQCLTLSLSLSLSLCQQDGEL
ncbi:kielin/chordin-like protein, partial [Rhinatrema bivittatum]|uniref:kielin/chordin-like protein n=1 Tax=Rhinatrema bivittatum TaxID=194408 RepID=UPI00112E2036